ncbi:MAG: hypothetical protein AT711_01415 [Thermoproteus sp. CIS_19]|jgi:hypothetical protein|nr:MAG: hypothetical protein AT711_01415 [Thermoproteus sp. CIS_19]
MFESLADIDINILKIELNITKHISDINQYPMKKLQHIIEELVKLGERPKPELLQVVLEAERCEYYESKRIFGLYRKEVRVKTHII